MSQHQFQVAGMSCGHCVRAVEEAVQGVDPNAQVKVELAQGQVQVESAQPREALAAAIAEAGYTVQ
jgi:copper chaperone